MLFLFFKTTFILFSFVSNFYTCFKSKGITSSEMLSFVCSSNFFLCCCPGLSLVAESRGYSLVAVWGLLVAVVPLAAEHRFSGMLASLVVASELSCLQHVGSS